MQDADTTFQTSNFRYLPHCFRGTWPKRRGREAALQRLAIASQAHGSDGYRYRLHLGVLRHFIDAGAEPKTAISGSMMSYNSATPG